MENRENINNEENINNSEIINKAGNRGLSRKEAIKRRNIFIALVSAVFLLVILLAVFIIFAITSGNDGENSSSIVGSSNEISSYEESSDESNSVLESSASESSAKSSSDTSLTETSSDVSSDESSSADSSASLVSGTNAELDPDFTNLLLVNGSNPLPENYDYEGNLVLIEDKYLCGYRNQLDADVMPYATAMVEAAWADGVDLFILSPYRSYDAQKVLYENEVTKWMNTGMDRNAAEDKAATVVARPGTSEHHTGMAIDFNSVEDSFEYTPEYEWLKANAQDYGFILRYTTEKQSITGVIPESWHWRFVGINEARKIKASGLCLEEYLEQNQ